MGESVFDLFVSGVNQVELGREVSPNFHFVTPGFESFPSDLPQERGCSLMCVECLSMIEPMVVGFCSVRG